MDSARVIKRRAKKACIACRSRKVRCDVTRTGTPCTNCQLDAKSCLVKEKVVRRCASSTAAKPEMHNVFDSSSFDVPATSPRSCASKSADGSTAKEPMNPDPAAALNQPENDTRHSPSEEALEPTPSVHSRGRAVAPEPSSQSYKSHAFLTLGNASSLSAQDLAFLEVKGALHVPERPLLDEFMRQYFLHVHPMLPLIDEGDFWDTYQQAEGGGSGKTISLLLFQAMTFASSTYVPDSVARSLGYDSIRSARSSFYHKTKLLFDFATEKTPMVLSQAAILLTLWCAPEVKSTHANSMWLQVGIQHARFVDAHRAWDTGPRSITNPQATLQDSRMLKRLWWCCLVRDCSLSVGIGRNIQIPAAYPPLSTPDFESEIGRSEVNDAQTKRLLAVIFSRYTHLCSNLSHVLRHLGHYGDYRDRPPSIDAGTFARCRLDIKEWLKETKAELRAAGRGNGVRKHCVIIHTNQMYIFYYGCLLFLSRQELLHRCASLDAPAGSPSHSGLSREMQGAVLGTVMCFEELTQLDLARYLHASAVAFISLPLLFHILETRFFHPKTHDLEQGARQNRLQVLIDAIKEYRLRYEGVEWLSFALRYVVGMVECAPPTRPLTSWTDVLAQTPSYGLTLILTIDLGLNQAKIPQDRDFPTALRGVLRPGLGAAKEPQRQNERAEAGNAGRPGPSAVNSFGNIGGVSGMGNQFEYLAAEREATSGSGTTDASLPDTVLPTTAIPDSIEAACTILQDMYPELIGTAALNDRGEDMEAAAPGGSDDAQYSGESFGTPSGKRLELDGMSFDLDSGFSEGELLEMLL